MPYFVIDRFQFGLDLRKGPVTSSPESLQVLRNAFVNAGAEIEKRRAFVQHVNVKGTVGLYGDGDEFVVFKPGQAGERAPLSEYVNSYGINDTDFDKLLSAQPWDDGYFTVFGQNDGTTKVFNKGQAINPSTTTGTFARLFGSKMYLTNGPTLQFSDINDPGEWDPTKTPNEGAGFVDVSKADLFGKKIYGIERYYQYLAVFGMSAIQLWALDPDPKRNQLAQAVGNTGLMTPNGLTQFANGDVLYLSKTGIRSLRARDASNFAITADIGSPIDTYIRERIRLMSEEQISKINAVVEPKTGAFWLSLGNEIIVLSFFPSAKVSAWSIFDAPEVDYIATNDQALAIRSGDDIYIYGGDYNQATFDDCEVVVRTPYLDAGKPASLKTFLGIDAAVEERWDIRYNLNPYIPDAWSQTATIEGQTFTLSRLPMQGMGTHIAFEFRTKVPFRARISSIVVHFSAQGSD